MADIESLKAGYGEILKLFFSRQEEKALFEVAELSKNLLTLRLGPDVLLDVHAACIKTAVKDLDPLLISRMVVNANDVLLSGMMAYAMSYYSFLDIVDAEKEKSRVAQLEVAAERDKIDNIVSAIDADLLLLDRDMKILWVNKRLKERSPFVGGEIIGQPCNKAYCNIEEVPCDCPAKLAFETGKPIRQEHPITHPDGTTRHYYFTCSPVYDHEGNHIHVLELVQDITDRYMQEEELRNKTRDLEDKTEELERFNKLFVDREIRMIELKEKIKELEGQGQGAGNKEKNNDTLDP